MNNAKTQAVPEVAIVVASFGDEAMLARCLESLGPLPLTVEVIVATNAPAEVVTRLESRFPDCLFVRAPRNVNVFRLRTLGLDQARAQLIALTEDHATFSPEWLEAFQEAYRAGHRVIGGPIENGVNSLYGWALFCCEYVALLPPLPDGPTGMLTGMNAAYDRDVLLACRATWRQRFHENEVHDTLQAAGHELWRAGKAVAASSLTMTFGEAVQHLFMGGRSFGCYRKSRSVLWLRLLLPAGAALVPVLLTMRILRTVAARRPQRLPRTIVALPIIIGFVTAWAAGEALGYLLPLRPAKDDC